MKDNLIQKILSFIDFESINKLVNIYIITFLDSERFDDFANYLFKLFESITGKKYKYRFAKKMYDELPKRIKDQNTFEVVYTHVKNFGNKYHKRNRIGKDVFYEKKMNSFESTKLKEFFFESVIPSSDKYEEVKRNKNIYNFLPIKEIANTQQVLDYLNFELGTEFDFTSSQDDIKASLKKLDIEFLEKLEYDLKKSVYNIYTYDYYSEFIDNTNIYTLFFIIENLKNIVANIDLIEHIMSLIMYVDEQQLSILSTKLKKKRSAGKVLPERLALISKCRFIEHEVKDEVNMRYHVVDPKLGALEPVVCYKIVYSFRKMTEIKWNILCDIIRTYSNPFGKPVYNYILDIID